jgi:hypothetical protein
VMLAIALPRSIPFRAHSLYLYAAAQRSPSRVRLRKSRAWACWAPVSIASVQHVELHS